MTSSPRTRGSSRPMPEPNSSVTNPMDEPRRKRGERCQNRRSRRAVDRAKQDIEGSPVPDHLYEVASTKGFVLIGRGRRSSDVHLRCRCCQQGFQVRQSVLQNNAPQCNHCMWRSRFENAMAVGATIVTPVRNKHKHANLTLPCGHSVQRQYGRLATAAKGGHRLGCDACREATYREQAEGSGWRLIGPATINKTGYRYYEHHCGHRQNFVIVNVDNRQLDCAGCGETWASKPSKIYLFEITLTDRVVLKLGYSSDPERRLRQQLGPAARDTGIILHVIDMQTGHAALLAEKQAHGHLHKTHPDWVVAHDVFADQINTKSEIYEPEARDIIGALMDRIKRKP